VREQARACLGSPPRAASWPGRVQAGARQDPATRARPRTSTRLDAETRLIMHAINVRFRQVLAALLSEIKNRGVRHVRMLVCDEPKRPADAVSAGERHGASVYRIRLLIHSSMRRKGTGRRSPDTSSLFTGCGGR
jgi:hypothetical protein